MTTGAKPVWLITYENVDVSDELSPMVVSAEYVDHLEGKADELRLTVEDKEGKWREGWWPSQNDRLAVQMGLAGEPLLDAGLFSVDEVELRGSPDTAQIGALSAPQTGNMRTKQSRSFEALTLRELATAMATELGLQLLGDVASVDILRSTQASETNVAYLRRLAKEYGYAFAIRPPHLVFFELAALEAAPPVLELTRAMLLPGWSLKGAVQDTYVACEVTWLDPTTKQTRTVRIEAADVRRAVEVGGGASVTEPLVLPARTLRQGSTGDDVRSWQTFLIGRGLDTGGLDGIFGPVTRQSTMAFQRDAGIEVDGVAGPETYRAAQNAGYSSTDGSPKADTSGKVLRLNERVESLEQAETKARAALAAANRLRVTGTLKIAGDRRLVAGATINLSEMGRLSGKYLVQDSRHQVSRGGGYTAEATVSVV